MKKEEALIVIENLRKEKELIIDNDLSKKVSIGMSRIYTLAILMSHKKQPTLCAMYLKSLAIYFGIDTMILALNIITIIESKNSISISDIIDITIDNIEKLVKED